MRHPFGTANRLVTFDGNFLELLSVYDPAELTGPGLMVRDLLEKSGPGAFGVALNATDIEALRTALAGKGVGVGPIGGGRRDVPAPSGALTAKFSTVMLEAPKEVPFVWFLAQQHVPEAVWIPEWRAHANSAFSLESVEIEMETPSATHPFFEQVFGKGSISSSGDEDVVVLPRGRIVLRECKAGDAPVRPCVTGVTIAVRDEERATAMIEKALAAEASSTGASPAHPAVSVTPTIANGKRAGALIHLRFAE